MNQHKISILRGAGLQPYEINNCDRITPLFALPETHGFGLLGGSGIGKTLALAWHLSRWVDELVGGTDRLAPYNFAVWSNWPSDAESIKSLSSPANWAALNELIDRMRSCRRLYLDDIGQERIRGEDDFSLGHLKTILDYRYRNALPVFWASNLGLDALSDAYGARIVSRVIQAWPPILIECAHDMRLTS